MMAIQGITPDLDDLASSRAFRILLQEVQSSRDWQDAADWQGQVAVPVVRGANWVMRQRSKPTCRGLIASIDFALEELCPIALHIPRARKNPLGLDPLIHLLCHLTC
jgi:hypothetical protein